MSETIGYILLIWPNSLKFGVTWPSPWDGIENFGSFTPWVGFRGLRISKPPFASLDRGGAYRSDVAPYFTIFRTPVTLTLTRTVEKFTLVYHSSTSTHIPQVSSRSDEKNVDGLIRVLFYTVISLQKWLKNEFTRGVAVQVTRSQFRLPQVTG